MKVALHWGGLGTATASAFSSRPIAFSSVTILLEAIRGVKIEGRSIPSIGRTEIYAREGVDIPRGLLADWIGCMGWLLTALAELIGTHVMTSGQIDLQARSHHIAATWGPSVSDETLACRAQDIDFAPAQQSQGSADQTKNRDREFGIFSPTDADSIR